MNQIEVKINGENSKIDTGMTVQKLAEMRNLKGFFAIEINLKIINKEDYSNTIINEGDEVEIVGFAGGG